VCYCLRWKLNTASRSAAKATKVVIKKRSCDCPADQIDANIGYELVLPHDPLEQPEPPDELSGELQERIPFWDYVRYFYAFYSLFPSGLEYCLS